MINQFKNTYFEKVSPKQFIKDLLASHPIFTNCEASEIYTNLELPRRATRNSSGYDFILPFDINIKPNDTINIPTGIKASMEDFLTLLLLPRSGLGFKYYVRLANTLGLGDCDYFNNIDNEGHYWVKIRNEGYKTLELKAGDRFCQGVFIPYYITINDNPLTEDRNGGLGHTGL